jgi:hypothetical protein
MPASSSVVTTTPVPASSSVVIVGSGVATNWTGTGNQFQIQFPVGAFASDTTVAMTMNPVNSSENIVWDLYMPTIPATEIVIIIPIHTDTDTLIYGDDGPPSPNRRRLQAENDCQPYTEYTLNWYNYVLRVWTKFNPDVYVVLSGEVRLIVNVSAWNITGFRNTNNICSIMYFGRTIKPCISSSSSSSSSSSCSSSSSSSSSSTEISLDVTVDNGGLLANSAIIGISIGVIGVCFIAACLVYRYKRTVVPKKSNNVSDMFVVKAFSNRCQFHSFLPS